MSSGGKRVTRTVSIDGRKRAKTSNAKKMSVYRGMGSVNGVHLIKRTALTNLVVGTAGVIVGGGAANPGFRIETNAAAVYIVGPTGTTTLNVPGWSDISGLFDLAKIKSVRVTFYAANQSGPNTSGVVAYEAVQLGTVIDKTDIGIPGAQTDLMQYGDFNFSTLDANKKYSRTFVPGILAASNYAGGASYSASSPWLLTDQTLPTQLGLKGWVLGPTNFTDLIIKVDIIYMCKAMK